MSDHRKPHELWSKSKLGMYERCGLQYQYRYLEGKIIPPGVALIVGTATHKAAQANLQNKIDHGTLLPEEEVAAVATDSVTQAVKGGQIMFSEDEVKEGVKKVLGSAKDRASVFSLAHARQLAPILNPIHLEREFILEPKGYPWALKGYMDVQEPDSIRDLKTGNRAPSQQDCDTSAQLTIYAWAHKALEGQYPAKVALDSISGDNAKVSTKESTRSDQEVAALVQRITLARDAIAKGVFLPASAGSNWCTPKWCGYWAGCPFGAKARTTVALSSQEV